RVSARPFLNPAVTFLGTPGVVSAGNTRTRPSEPSLGVVIVPREFVSLRGKGLVNLFLYALGRRALCVHGRRFQRQFPMRNKVLGIFVPTPDFREGLNFVNADLQDLVRARIL